MPTYEYACSKCDERIEVYQTFDEKPLTRHKGCGGKLTKVFAPVGVVLKGPGFYKTDNARGNGGGSTKASSDSSSGSSSSSDSSD